MKPKEALKVLYHRFNKKYFKNRLPADMKVVLFKVEDYMGYAYTEENKIAIHRAFKHWPRVMKETLLHEMVHFVVGAGHGKRFQKEIDRLYKAGAYKGVL